MNFKDFLQEAYDFFPKTNKDIETSLASWSGEQIKDAKKLLDYFKKNYSSVELPINFDVNNKRTVNVSRYLKSSVDINKLKKDLNINSFNLKYGNGSLGNRGKNNKGSQFEQEYADSIWNWWSGIDIDPNHLESIEDIYKTYKLDDSKYLNVDIVASANTKRPIEYGSKIIITNPTGSGYDIGQAVSDITLQTDTGKTIYLSLKSGSTTTFFNVGVKTVLTKPEIESGKIKNPNGLNLLKLFGIKPDLFCDVFNGNLTKKTVDKNPRFDKSGLTELLKSGIGHGYHVIHKKGSKVESKKMDVAAMNRAANVGRITVYYGGLTGSGKRIDVVFDSPDYHFKVNIRDTQGGDGYPTRMMCDFVSK